jgi:hypothetical protein
MRRTCPLLLVLAACLALGGAPAVADTATCPNALAVGAAAGAPGNVTVAWGEGCELGVTDVVASSSTAAGVFVDAVVVSPPGAGVKSLARVVSDAAGDTWVFGTTHRVVHGPKAQQDLELIGRWVAFQPAGGAFATTSLPANIPTPFVAVSPSGRIVMAWTTSTGSTAIATADRSANFSRLPAQRGFLVADVGIDASGAITLAGVPAYGQPGEGRWVETLTGTTSGRFTKTVVDRLPRPTHGCGRHGPTPVAGRPQLSVAPSGSTLLAWSIAFEQCSRPNPVVMVAQHLPGAGFSPRRRVPADIPAFQVDGNVAIDDAGRGLIGWERGDGRYAVDVIDGHGTPRPRPTTLGVPFSRGTIVVAPGGAAAAVIRTVLRTGQRISVSTGSTTSGLGPPQTLPGGPLGAIALDPVGNLIAATGAANAVTVQGLGPAPFGPVTVTAAPHTLAR